MFLTSLKTVVVEALKGTFTASYAYPNGPLLDDQGAPQALWVSIEYPAKRASYPGIWVGFTPTADTQAAGLDRAEATMQLDNGVELKLGTWRYGGMIQMTAVALTSLERDMLVDEIAKVVAFGDENLARKYFRTYIENNDLIQMQPQWDKMAIGGLAETPGAPWGTEEVIYEATVSIDTEGQFFCLPESADLVPLSAIITYPVAEGHTGPPPTQDPSGWI